MVHSERHTTRGSAGELSYLEWQGPAEAPPILYLHPVNTAAAVWTAVAERLDGIRPAFAVDYRAHGGSEAAGPYLPADYAADALAVLDARGVDKAHVVCGSIGGAVATELAAASPDRVASIVAFGATLRVGWDEPALDATEHDLRALGVREWFVRHGAGILGPAGRPEAARELVELASGGRDGDRDVDTVVEVLRTTFGLADSRPAGEAVARRVARPPARVFVGTHDPTCPVEMAAELAGILGGDLHTMTDIGHLPMLEDPVATAAAVAHFHAGLVEGVR
ncbi:alpha/beta fold hydrolase [Pseudonocardia sp. N23]|uniref:alpha/beta fold hydrolase n=1 Tax=Pseudonocardia sp. N23 TaxID=1987376 RepID=UPI000BFD29F6|nr:alpha/beta hydrolase [Pseudonocardia sp. N23]GAY12936.1 3-oxoadipate enol-lactone hydrolase [Pseudonocardia sp. N23]